MMAEIALTGVEDTIAEHGFATVQEPAVGAGGMVIAVVDVIEERGFDPATHLWVEATELSLATYHMGFIQIHARGVAGRVFCGNSLSGEIYTSVFTGAAPAFYAAHGDPFAKQRAAAEEAAQQQQAREDRLQADRETRLRNLGREDQPGPMTQLGLFD